ncbi:hypothetical protein EON63_07190 [archaeon]|nr:MAG: hypothetical protein EON63_07190 [archaeon]
MYGCVWIGMCFAMRGLYLIAWLGSLIILVYILSTHTCYSCSSPIHIPYAPHKRFGMETGETVWEECNLAFDRLPLAGIIDHEVGGMFSGRRYILCVCA